MFFFVFFFCDASQVLWQTCACAQLEPSHQVACGRYSRTLSLFFSLAELKSSTLIQHRLNQGTIFWLCSHYQIRIYGKCEILVTVYQIYTLDCQVYATPVRNVWELRKRVSSTILMCHYRRFSMSSGAYLKSSLNNEQNFLSFCIWNSIFGKEYVVSSKVKNFLIYCTLYRRRA